MSKSIYDRMPTYKVVDFALSTGIRTGHILAQHKLTESEFFGSVDANRKEWGIDNGFVFFLGADGNIAKNPDTNLASSATPFLHFTEERRGGYSKELKHWAPTFTDEIDGANGAVAYPRCVALYTGDVFITDNYTGDIETNDYAKVVDGVLTLSATIPTSGPAFRVVKSTLPDGTTVAAEFTVLTPCV